MTWCPTTGPPEGGHYNPNRRSVRLQPDLESTTQIAVVSGFSRTWNPILHILRSPWTELTKDQDAREQADDGVHRQVRVPGWRGQDAPDEHGAREFDDGRRRPDVQIEMKALGQNLERVDDWRDEEARLQHEIGRA